MSTESTSTEANPDNSATVSGSLTAEVPAERCGQCWVPAAPEQRYCLNCGFRRRNAPDPVSRYLSEASAARTALLVGALVGRATAGHSA